MLNYWKSDLISNSTLKDKIMPRDLLCEEIRSFNAFKDLSEETIERICCIANRKKLQKGQILFLEKDMMDTFYAVLDGSLSMYRVSSNGQKRVFFLLDKGHLVNEVVFDDKPVSVICEAFEASEVAEFSKKDFLSIMEKDFRLTMNILSSIGHKQRRLYRQLKNTLPIGIEKRLAAKLWKLSKDHGVKVNEWQLIDLGISVTYLSYMLGTSRETISRSMKVLTKMDAVKWDNRQLYVKEKLLLSYYRS